MLRKGILQTSEARRVELVETLETSEVYNPSISGGIS